MSDIATVDYIAPTESGFKVQGEVASKLQQNGGLNINGVMRMRPYINERGQAVVTQFHGNKAVMVPVANATLRKDEWKQLDEALVKIRDDRLTVVKDIEAAGLTYNISNGMGTTVLEYEDVSDITDAERNMDGVSRSQQDRMEYDLNYLPLPITHKDFSFNLRVLEASRTRGDTLDTSMMERATRKVNESIESMAVTGAGAFTFGGGTIRGLLDVTTRNTVSITTNWDAAGKTGAQILTNVLDMIQAAINAKHFGPFMLYIPTAYETVMGKDYASGYPKSIRERLMELESIQGIKVADKLTANNVVLVEMQSDTIRMVNGMAMTVVEWESNGGLRKHFKVMKIQVPQIRADQDGNSGIVHLS